MPDPAEEEVARVAAAIRAALGQEVGGCWSDAPFCDDTSCRCADYSRIAAVAALSPASPSENVR